MNDIRPCEAYVTFNLGYHGNEISYTDPVWSGDYFRSLSETYDWQRTYRYGMFTFNWIYKICVF